MVVITATRPGAVRSTTSLGVSSAVLSKLVDVVVLLKLVGYLVSQRQM